MDSGEHAQHNWGSSTDTRAAHGAYQPDALATARANAAAGSRQNLRCHVRLVSFLTSLKVARSGELSPLAPERNRCSAIGEGARTRPGHRKIGFDHKSLRAFKFPRDGCIIGTSDLP